MSIASKIKYIIIISTVLSCKKTIMPSITDNPFITIINTSNQDTIQINGKPFKIDLNAKTPYKNHYMEVSVGKNTIKLFDKIKQKTVIDTNFTFLKNTYYTILVYDSALNTKTILVKDNLPQLTKNVSYFRFFNLYRNLQSFNFSYSTERGTYTPVLDTTFLTDLPSTPEFFAVNTPLASQTLYIRTQNIGDSPQSTSYTNNFPPFPDFIITIVYVGRHPGFLINNY